MGRVEAGLGIAAVIVATCLGRQGSFCLMTRPGGTLKRGETADLSVQLPTGVYMDVKLIILGSNLFTFQGPPLLSRLQRRKQACYW